MSKSKQRVIKSPEESRDLHAEMRAQGLIPYRTSAEMVDEFHRVVVGLRPGDPNGAAAPDVPTAIPDDRLLLRGRLIVEEVGELLCAITGHHGKTEKAYKMQLKALFDHMWETRNPMDLIEVADGCVDSHVVISGTALEAGIPEDEVYVEVHRTNMAKAGGPVREDGKRLKPEGWKPPNIKKVLKKAGWEG